MSEAPEQEEQRCVATMDEAHENEKRTGKRKKRKVRFKEPERQEAAVEKDTGEKDVDDWRLESCPSSPRIESNADDYSANKLAQLARNAVIYVGVGFFVLFSGHAVFRSLLPALKPQSGALLVAANFFAYAIGSLIHPRFLMSRRRLCFSLGALAHAQWIAVLQLPTQDGNVTFIVLTAISSVINGFGAGLLWSTEGGWIGEFCSLDDPRRAGHYTGIFLSLYGASGFIGNVAAALTLYFASSSVLTVVWYLFAIALAGVIVLLCAPSRFLYAEAAQDCAQKAEFAKQARLEETVSKSRFAMLSGGISKRVHFQTASEIECDDDSATKENAGGKSEIAVATADSAAATVAPPKPKRWTTIKALFRETVFTRSIPGISALSSVSVFSWVSVPTLCSAAFTTADDGTSTAGAYVVPALFAVYAFANAVGAPTSSLFLRRFSIAVVFSSVSLLLALPTMIYFMFLHRMVPQQHAIYSLGVASLVFGICVGTYNNCLYALYASTITTKMAEETSLPLENRPHLSGEAYCIHGFLYCVFYTLFSTLVAFLPMPAIAGLVAATTVAASISFMCLRLPKTCQRRSEEEGGEEEKERTEFVETVVGAVL